MPKVLSVHLKRTDEWRDQQWPPDNFFKDIDDAIEIELYSMPGKSNRIWMYLEWQDGYKYFTSWDRDLLNNFLNTSDKHNKLIKKKMKEWDLKLAKKLMKGARNHPMEKWPRK